MEELNKTQTILLCLLVSFVTSIGTGIITVSLLQEAPQSVTQTINRVVERTVEKVVPQSTGSAPTKEVTVVVKEEDLVIDAIGKNSKSIARIVQNGAQGENVFAAIGLVISTDGKMISDKKNFIAGNSYTATFFDGKSFPIKIETLSEKTDAVLLSVVKDASVQYTFNPAVTANSDVVQLGQSIIAIGGKTSSAVTIGRITGVQVEAPSSANATSTRLINVIETDAPPKENAAGTLLVNLNGEIVGVYLPNANEASSRYVAIDVIKRANGNFFGLPNKNSP